MRLSLIIILLFSFKVSIYAGIDNLVQYSSPDGSMSNYNNPAIIEDQLGGYMTGGSLLLRGPRPKELNPISIQTPKIKYDACTGSGDFRFGAMSYISSEEFSKFLKNVAKASSAYLVKMSIKTACPQCEDIMTYLETVARDINGLMMNQCSLAEALTKGAISKIASSEKQRCMMEANAFGHETDMFATTKKCQSETGNPASSKTKESKEFEDMLGSEFNLVWKALRRGSETDTNFKELMMSISGTIISKKEEGRYKFTSKPSLIQDKALLEKFIGNSSGGTKIKIYVCDTKDKCLNPHEGEKTLKLEETLYGNISKIMDSLIDKVKKDNPKLSDDEEGLIGFSTIPIINLIEMELATKAKTSDLLVRMREFIEVVCYDVITNYMQIMLSRVIANVQSLSDAQIDSSIIRNFTKDAENTRKYLVDAKFSAFQKLKVILHIKEKLDQQNKEFEFRFSNLMEHIRN